MDLCSVDIYWLNGPTFNHRHKTKTLISNDGWETSHLFRTSDLAKFQEWIDPIESLASYKSKLLSICCCFLHFPCQAYTRHSNRCHVSGCTLFARVVVFFTRACFRCWFGVQFLGEKETVFFFSKTIFVRHSATLILVLN